MVLDPLTTAFLAILIIIIWLLNVPQIITNRQLKKRANAVIELMRKSDEGLVFGAADITAGLHLKSIEEGKAYRDALTTVGHGDFWCFDPDTDENGRRVVYNPRRRQLEAARPRNA